MTQTFVAKVDEFAATLSPIEQAMLAHLVTGGDEVTGFGIEPGWPGLGGLVSSPMGFDAGIQKTGGGNDILRIGMTDGGNDILRIQKTGGGNDI